MFDIKHNKAKHYKSVTKSNTTVALPQIRKNNTTEIKQLKNNSGYLQTISYLSSNIDYDQKNQSFVNKQQNTLKSILKKMNYDTMQLISHLKPKKNHKVVNKQMQNQTVEMQLQNRNKLIHIMENQIQQLKEKYKLIVEHHQDVEVGKKIVSIRNQIEELRQQNVERKAKMNKEGKQLQKYSIQGNNQSKIITIQTDHQFAINKLDKLKAQSTKVDEQNSKLTSKIQELQPFIQQLEEQCQVIKNKQSSLALGKNREYQQLEKKNQMENIKKRIQFIKHSSQVKYYKLLKELENQRTSARTRQIKTTQIQTRTKLAKEQIGSLQSMLGQIKRKKKEKGQQVMEYLASSRKLIQGEDSRVLSDLPSANEQMKTQRLKTEEDILHQNHSFKESKTQEIKVRQSKVEEVKEQKQQNLSEQKDERQNLSQKQASIQNKSNKIIKDPAQNTGEQTKKSKRSQNEPQQINSEGKNSNVSP